MLETTFPMAEELLGLTALGVWQCHCVGSVVRARAAQALGLWGLGVQEGT